MVTKKQEKQPIIPRNCTTQRGLALLGDEWTMLVLVALENETKRFSQLRTDIEGISKKMLTQTLRSLERDGLVRRVVYPVVPPVVEYSLTCLGKTLKTPIQAMRDWSEEYIEKVEQARIEYDQQDKSALQAEIMALVQQRATT
jgi:DNA-binding HxlR family transcriptional regulator